MRPGPDGLLVTMGLYTDTPCSLPTRPRVQFVIAGRRAVVHQMVLNLTGTQVTRRVIRPKEPATAVLRWRNWCGAHGPVVMLLTLGGVTIHDEFGAETTSGPSCVDPSAPSTLAVSRFVRR